VDEASGGLNLLYLILSILVIILIAFLLFVAVIGYKLVTPPRLVGKWTPKDFGANYKDVEVITEDGIKLRGWHILGDDRCVILLHGYTVSRWDEVYMKKMMEFLWSNGYSVLAFDFRAHGESEGKHTTIGDKEFLDVRAIFEYAKKRCDKVYIIGYSMGGFLALKAAASGMGDKIIADSPFIYVDKSGARGLKYFANLPSWLYRFIKPFAILFSGINYANTDPFKFAGDIKVPTLIIAGKNDPLITVDEVSSFVKASGNKVELWITEGAHVRTIQVSENEYKKRVLSFLSQ